MSPTDADLSELVEFKLWLVRSLEEYVMSELAQAAKAQGRRLPAVTRTLLRTGATSAVSDLQPGDLARFAEGSTWAESIRAAVDNGAWSSLVDDTIRHAFAPEAT